MVKNVLQHIVDFFFSFFFFYLEGNGKNFSTPALKITLLFLCSVHIGKNNSICFETFFSALCFHLEAKRSLWYKFQHSHTKNDKERFNALQCGKNVSKFLRKWFSHWIFSKRLKGASSKNYINLTLKMSKFAILCTEV